MKLKIEPSRIRIYTQQGMPSLEVGEDPEFGDLIEVFSYDDDGKITLTSDEASALVEVLQQILSAKAQP